ncbi:MAG: hypothetical protein ACREX8_04310, partial [Gammaproteobacteria bacterium]
MPEAIFDLSPEVSLGELFERLRVMREEGILEEYTVHDPIDLINGVAHLKIKAGAERVEEVADVVGDEPRLVASRVCDACVERAADTTVSDRIGKEVLEFSLCAECVLAGKDARLTADQLDLIPGLLDRWVGMALSTEPADRPAAERAVARAYRSAGLDPPARIVWLGSPLAGVLVASALLGLQGHLGGPGRRRLSPRAEWTTEIGDFLKGDLSYHGSKRYVE